MTKVISMLPSTNHLGIDETSNEKLKPYARTTMEAFRKNQSSCGEDSSLVCKAGPLVRPFLLLS
jgi:hypothetical protein